MTREDIVENIREDLISEYGDTDQAEEIARDMANNKHVRIAIEEEELINDAYAERAGARFCKSYSSNDEDAEDDTGPNYSEWDKLKGQMVLAVGVYVCYEGYKLIQKGWRWWRSKQDPSG